MAKCSMNRICTKQEPQIWGDHRQKVHRRLRKSKDGHKITHQSQSSSITVHNHSTEVTQDDIWLHAGEVTSI